MDLGTRVLAAAELREAVTAAAGIDWEVLTPTTTRPTPRPTAPSRRCATLRTPYLTWTPNSPPPRARPRAADERRRQNEERLAHVNHLAHAHTAVAASTATPTTTVTDLIETISTRAHAYRNLGCDRHMSSRIPVRPRTLPRLQWGNATPRLPGDRGGIPRGRSEVKSQGEEYK
ncbi:hypothetical protein GFS60_06318 (plasmid) [Rhodococcus sp. WAY2]|nr:hypothetical protein GFS60_06318 [Rhodococcus sp. WAY2]